MLLLVLNIYRDMQFLCICSMFGTRNETRLRQVTCTSGLLAAMDEDDGTGTYMLDGLPRATVWS